MRIKPIHLSVSNSSNGSQTMITEFAWLRTLFLISSRSVSYHGVRTSTVTPVTSPKMHLWHPMVWNVVQITDPLPSMATGHHI